VKKPLAAIAALALACAAGAEDFPQRPVTLVVPFAAGGPTDHVARHLAEALRKPLGGQPVLIENVGGLGGTLGATKVAKADPDGHTLLLYHIGMATSPALYRDLPYRALEDFEYLGLVNEVPMTLVGRPGLPATTFAELRAWIKANRGKVHLAHAGQGAASHLCGLLLMSTLGIEMTTVAYKGTAPAMADLLGGHVDLLCDQTTNTTAPIESGRVKAYAVTATQRLTMPALAGLPTLDEAGLKGVHIAIWHGLYAPRGTPKAVTDRLNAALRQALEDPEFIRREEAVGAVIVNDRRLSGAEHRKFVAAETARWAPVIKAAEPYAN
jgi:tripartite-type tricarboxylate transporter receptor subunit TctC